MFSNILIFFSALLLVMMINVNSFALGKKLMFNGYYPEANNQVNVSGLIRLKLPYIFHFLKVAM